MSRTTLPKWMRDQLPKKCCNCGETHGLVYHHIVPLENGGIHMPSNIAVMCSICHGRIHYGKDGYIDHGELVKSGMARAMAAGVRVGRTPADEVRVMETIAKYSTQFNPYSLDYEEDVMRMAGVKLTCYSRCKRKLIEAMGESEWPYSFPKPEILRNRPLYPSVIRRRREEIFEYLTR